MHGRFRRSLTSWLGAAVLGACGADAVTNPGPADGPPQRIVPATAAAADVVLALVPADRVAGVPALAFDYTDTLGVRADWQRPVFERYAGEELLALRPDLVLAMRFQKIDTTALLRRNGIRVLELPDITALDDVCRTVELVAAAVGADAAGADLVADLRRRAAALAADGARRGVRAITYTNFGTGGWTAGSGGPEHLLLTLAGLENASADGGRRGHHGVDVERLLVLDPDIVVVGAPAAGAASSSGHLRADATLSMLRAVRENRIVILPVASFSASSHRIVDAAERLARAVDAVLERAPLRR